MMRWLIHRLGDLLTPTAKQFQAALNQPQLIQKKVQQSICDRLIRSSYGKSLNVCSVADWQQIPIVEYDDISALILPPSAFCSLTPEPVQFYERTSGSRGAAKWIPYTNSLRQSFSQMFCIWAQDLIRKGPGFSTGKTYFCVSPQLTVSDVAKAQLKDDAEYLDLWLQWVLRPFLVASGLKHLRDPEKFKHSLCLQLLQAENLEIISIWSPSFLQVLLDYIQSNRLELQRQLQHQISHDRYQILSEPEINWSQLWADLKLISCWDSVYAADPANGLRSQFPKVLVQGKGLLATEAPMTIPLIAAQGCVPVLDEVFFEFEDTTGNFYWLHELEIGQTYTIVLSQKGGLYRYRIGDRVRVTHFYCQTPCLEFIGRSHSISDLVGEKLHEEFVQQVWAELPLAEANFKHLSPVLQPRPHYVMLVDHLALCPTQLAHQLDQLLCRSPHYAHARLLNQLAPTEVLIAPDIADQLTRYRLKSGCALGDIKHPILATVPLEAEFIAALKGSMARFGETNGTE